MRLHHIAITTIAAMAVVFSISWVLTPEQQYQAMPPAEQVVDKTYLVPIELQPIVDRLGITDRTVEIKTDFPCTPTARACFDTAIHYPYTMLQQPILQQNATMAHEYMHYIYDKQEYNYRVSIENLAVGLYNTTPSFQRRMKWYTDKGTLNNDELISVACTEVDDSILPAQLYEYCAKYVPNRLALPSSIR